jgi:hypothetical protein
MDDRPYELNAVLHRNVLSSRPERRRFFRRTPFVRGVAQWRDRGLPSTTTTLDESTATALPKCSNREAAADSKSSAEIVKKLHCVIAFHP